MDDTELIQGINNIFNEIIFSANERARKHPLYHQLRDDAKELLSSPDVFAIRFYTPTMDAIRQAVIDEIGSEQKNNSKLASMYLNYKFIVNNLKNFIAKKDGIACSSDKARRVLQMYLLQVVKGDELGDRLSFFDENNKRLWNTPGCGEPAQWFDLIDGLIGLGYGLMDEFISSVDALNSAYKLRQVR